MAAYKVATHALNSAILNSLVIYSRHTLFIGHLLLKSVKINIPQAETDLQNAQWQVDE
jgi:hypothetical protein